MYFDLTKLNLIRVRGELIIISVVIIIVITIIIVIIIIIIIIIVIISTIIIIIIIIKHRWTYLLRTLPDIQDLLEPLEDAISHMLIPAITERKCNQLDRNTLALPVRMGGLGLGNPSLEARREYASSVKVAKPLVEQIVSQSHQLPEDSLTKLAQQSKK